MGSQKALLVIDMQKGSFTPETPRHDRVGVVERINGLSAEFRARYSPVVYIQHDGTGSGTFEKGTEEWAILDDLMVAPTDLQIDKYANDVFYRSKLQATLDSLGVNELYITGCATDFCVESTIQSALVKDYQVTVVADGHTTTDRPLLSAEQVIGHYNWVWQNMLPTQGVIRVKKYDQIKSELKLKV